MKDLTLGPGWYAAGAVLVVPFCALAIVAMGLVLLAMWPVWPFVAYKQRKEEIENPMTEEETP